MQLSESIQVNNTPALSALYHRVKNVYNLANFYTRQEYFIVGNLRTYYNPWFMLRDRPACQALPA